MDSVTVVFGVVGAVLVGVSLGGFLLLRKKNEELEAYERKCMQFSELQMEFGAQKAVLESTKKELHALKASYEELASAKDRINEEKIRIQAKTDALEAANEKLKEHYEEQSKKLELKLNDLMQKTLEKKIEKFDETSAKSLQTILKPFAESVESFKKRLEQNEEKNAKRFTELSKDIEFIGKVSNSLTQEAQNLAEALKGKKQTTGAWGEMILDSVLEYSGLMQGMHYEKQNSYRDDDGELKRPDVVVKLPANRSIVIDSKVSLVNYDKFVREESEEAKNIAAKALANNFKEHIDTLASKDYTHYDIGTLQYVFMFVPIEGAFSVALGADPSLYEYALKKHIAITTPSTLTVSLRTIYLYWQSEKSSEYALKLFEEAGKLYDKVVGFATTFERVGVQLKTVQNSYDEAYKQLALGRGNVLGRVEKLKTLGAKTTKNLSSTKIEYEDFDQEDVEVELLESKSQNADVESDGTKGVDDADKQ